MECVHLLDNVNSDIKIFDKDKATKNFNCSECDVIEQNWMCLQCGVVNCGRYINEHAKRHAEMLDHQLCMSCDVFSIYCYKCDDYISNCEENKTIEYIRKQFMNISTVEENKPNNIVISNEDKDVEVDIMNTPNNKQNDTSLLSTTECEIDVIPTSTSGLSNLNSSTDVTENMSPNSNKIGEEIAKSLRTRSRKRTHSEENSSESSNPSLKIKEKKLLQLNGKNLKDKKIVGLKNLGNTCFMNAVLQSLNNIQEFSCYFSQLPSLEVKTNGRKVYQSRNYTRQDVHDVVMAEELRKVLRNLNNGGCGSKGAISPECLFLVIWKVVPRFRGYQQQDAHEFLRYMLDRLHTELLQLLPENTGDNFLPRAPSASIVTAVFGGTLQSEVRCLSCGAESKKIDPFLDLSLELPEVGRHDAPVPLAECLASFVQVEELADTERYFCSSCKCKQKSTKQFSIRRLPNVLCLHLKRFRWHNYFRTKVDTSISFPLSDLDMSRFVLPNVPETRHSGLGSQLYDLAAVIVHHGSGAGSGHYTAFAINEEQWFHFNDQTVRPTEAETVAACKPYILFYIRREIA